MSTSDDISNRIMTVGQLRDYVKNRPRFESIGKWKLKRDTLELVHQDTGYPFDLERLDLDFVLHVCRKGCFSTKDIGDLLHAITELTSPAPGHALEIDDRGMCKRREH